MARYDGRGYVEDGYIGILAGGIPGSVLAGRIAFYVNDKRDGTYEIYMAIDGGIEVIQALYGIKEL